MLVIPQVHVLDLLLLPEFSLLWAFQNTEWRELLKRGILTLKEQEISESINRKLHFRKNRGLVVRIKRPF